MAGFRVLRTNHMSFTVSDLDRSIAFFRDALGFQVTTRASRNPALSQSITGVEGANLDVAYARGPDHSLELIQYRAPDERAHIVSRPCDTGFAHIAFDVDDIDAAVSEAAEFDVHPIGRITVIDRGPNTGNRVCYLQDWDGVTIEFIEKAEA